MSFSFYPFPIYFTLLPYKDQSPPIGTEELPLAGSVDKARDSQSPRAEFKAHVEHGTHLKIK